MTCEECPSHRSLKVKIRIDGAMMIIPTRSRPAAMGRTVPRHTARAGRDQAWAVAAAVDSAVAMTIEAGARAGRHHLALVGAVGLRWKGIMIIEMMAMMKENGEVKVELGIQVDTTADDRRVRIGERTNVRITKQDREINKKDGMEKQEEEEGEEMTRDQEMIKDLF